MIDWDLIERIIDAVPLSRTGMGDLGDAYVKVLGKSGIDHNQDEDHYHLLLKIHSIKGPTLRSRFESYISRNGRNYTNSSYALTVTEPNSSRGSLALHQQNGRNEDYTLGQTVDTEDISSVPEEFVQRKSRAREEVGMDMDSDETEKQQYQEDDTTEESIRVRPFAGLATPLRTPLPLPTIQSDRRQSYTPQPIEAIRSRLLSAHDLPQPRYPAPTATDLSYSLDHSMNGQQASASASASIRAKIPFLADVQSDLEVGERYNGEDEGDDELGASDLEPVGSTPLKAAVSNHRRQRGGYMSDGPVGGRRANGRVNGYLSDSTVEGRVVEKQQEPAARTRFSTYRPPTPAVNPLISRLMGEPTPIINPERSGVPITYAGPVNQRSAAAAEIQEMRALEQEAYGMERAFEEAGGDPQHMLVAALSYYREGTVAKALERWIGAMRYETLDRQEDYRQFNVARLRRSFAFWRHNLRHRSELRRRARQIYSQRVKGRALVAWLHALRVRQLDRECEAFKIRVAARRKRRTFEFWREKRAHIREDRWKSVMGSKARVLRGKHDQGLLQRIMVVWRNAPKRRIAQEHYSAVLTRKMLDIWRGCAARIATCHRLEGGMVKAQEKVVKQKAMRGWMTAVALRITERDFVEVSEEGVKREALMTWRGRLVMQVRADQFSAQREVRAAFGRWKKRYAGVKALHRKSHVLRVDHDASTLRKAYDTWMTSHRGVLLGLRRDWEERRRSLGIWRGRIARVQEMTNLARSRSDIKEVASAKQCLQIWRQRSQAITTSHNLAKSLSTHNTLKHAFQTWTKRIAVQRARERAADDMRAFFVSRICLAEWRYNARGRRLRGYREEKSRRVLRGVFQGWRNAAARQKDLRRKGRAMTRKSNKGLVRSCLQHWIHRVIANKEREIQVQETYDKAVMRVALERWTAATVKQGEMLSLMQSFRDVRDQDWMRAIAHGWNNAAKASLGRKQSSQLVHQRSRERSLRQAWGQWEYRLKGRLLQPMATDLKQKFDDGLLYAALATWKLKSTRLPAIEFDAMNRKRQAWDRWMRAIPKARKLREIAAVEDKKLCSDMLQRWKFAYRAKVARRAAARTRGTAIRLRSKPLPAELSYPSPPPQYPRRQQMGDATMASDMLGSEGSGRRRRSIYNARD